MLSSMNPASDTAIVTANARKPRMNDHHAGGAPSSWSTIGPVNTAWMAARNTKPTTSATSAPGPEPPAETRGCASTVAVLIGGIDGAVREQAERSFGIRPRLPRATRSSRHDGGADDPGRGHHSDEATARALLSPASMPDVPSVARTADPGARGAVGEPSHRSPSRPASAVGRCRSDGASSSSPVSTFIIVTFEGRTHPSNEEPSCDQRETGKWNRGGDEAPQDACVRGRRRRHLAHEPPVWIGHERVEAGSRPASNPDHHRPCRGERAQGPRTIASPDPSPVAGSMAFREPSLVATSSDPPERTGAPRRIGSLMAKSHTTTPDDRSIR